TLRISLLTCSPGEELYSTFGHTAVRVTDISTGMDLVYNYGTFEFSPDFYAKFVQGKLRYYLSVEPFEDFLYAYQWESRSVVEQVLQLDCANRAALYEALRTNALEENKFYLYDFLFDNCTTRPKMVLQQTITDSIQYKNILPPQTPTFRNLIHSYLDSGGQYWSKLGIDLLLGAKLDRKVTNQQAMFLPDYLLMGLDSATLNGQPLVTPPQPVLQMPSPLNKGSLFRPGVVFGILLLVIIALSFTKKSWAQKTLRAIDFTLFLLAGIVGLVLIYMWTGTDHVVTQNNYNLLWALPTHLIAAFLLGKNKKGLRTYFKAALVLHLLLLLLWAFLPQQLNGGFIYIVAMLAFACWRHSKQTNHAA
ncbi:MAG: DUF4105 domain-containing protein, partial [Chitinophagaceae bacterium]